MPKKNIIVRVLKIIGITVISVIGLIYVSIQVFFWNISSDSGIQYNVSGTVTNFGEGYSDNIYINFNSTKVITKTDSIGDFVLHKPQELFIRFDRKGYQSITTTIQEYSDVAVYKFSPFKLEKSSDTIPIYKELPYEREKDTIKQVNFKGQIKDVYGNPLEDVLVTLTDTINTDVSFDGTFDFNRGSHFISFEKKGYEKLSIKINEFVLNRPEDLKEIILLKKKKGGIYLVQKNKLLALSKIRLKRTYEERYTSVLWGGRYGYNLDSFFYPKKAKEFKIKKNVTLPIRFVVYEEGFNHFFLATQPNDFLCYVDHKSVFSSFPRGIHRDKEVISEYYERLDEKGKVLELLPEPDYSENEFKYVFVSAKSKKGYCFRY